MPVEKDREASRGATNHHRHAQDEPDQWGPRLLLGQDGTLIGNGGWKGPPLNGAAELGDAVAPARQGCGVATTVVRELVRRAQVAGHRPATWRRPVDGCMTKAPHGGETAGPSPVDRRKGGLKRSVASDGDGIPLGLVSAPAQRHDLPLLAPTLAAARSQAAPMAGGTRRRGVRCPELRPGTDRAVGQVSPASGMAGFCRGSLRSSARPGRRPGLPAPPGGVTSRCPPARSARGRRGSGSSGGYSGGGMGGGGGGSW
jgi:hypothetical protein